MRQLVIKFAFHVRDERVKYENGLHHTSSKGTEYPPRK